jgi:hypothetical protein
MAFLDRSPQWENPRRMENRERASRTYQLDISMNGSFNGAPAPMIQRYQKVKASELTSPPAAQVFTFIDPHPAAADESGFGVQILAISGLFDGWSSLPGAQHNHGCNAAFADRMSINSVGVESKGIVSCAVLQPIGKLRWPKGLAADR